MPAIPTTDHSVTLNRREGVVIETIKAAVDGKIQAGRVAYKGPRRKQLVLQNSQLPGLHEPAFDAWLSLGEGKRRLAIFPQKEITMEQMKAALGEALERHGVEVTAREDADATVKEEKIVQEHIHNGRVVAARGEAQEEDMQDRNGQASHAPSVQTDVTQEDRWIACELIYESVKESKEYDSKEASLQAQLEQVRAKRQAVKANAMETLAQVIGPAAA